MSTGEQSGGALRARSESPVSSRAGDRGSDGPPPRSRLERLGLIRPLLLGYVGLLLFMIGDGVEANYLAPYFEDVEGFSASAAATVITVYGVPVAIGSWLSGTLSAVLGPRRVMAIGAAIWIVFELLFLTVGLRSGEYTLVLLTYGLRGFGYPLFAFPFLLWITATAEPERRSKAVAWFWLGFTGGLPTLGALFASGSIPLVGEYATFWLSLALVVAGAGIALLGLRASGVPEPRLSDERPAREQLASGLSVAVKRPKVGLLGIVRVINTTPQYGFFVFLPGFFEDDIGLSQSQYLILVTLTYAANLPGGLVFGAISDRIGWRRSIAWFGGVGCAVATLVLYYGPLAVGDNFVLCTLCAMTFGFMLAGYTAIPPLMSVLTEQEERGASFSIYALAAGLSAFAGPGLVALFQAPLGTGGLIWIFVGLYLLTTVISLTLTSAGDPGEGGLRRQAAEPGASAVLRSRPRP